MTNADKQLIIQDLQCKHGDWLIKYDKNLSYGICTQAWMERNLMISNLIEVLYRYNPRSTSNCLELTDINNIVCSLRELLVDCNC